MPGTEPLPGGSHAICLRGFQHSEAAVKVAGWGTLGTRGIKCGGE